MNGKVQAPDTIAAIATPAGRGAIGIVRVSGPAAIAIARRLFRGRRPADEIAGGTFARGWIEAEGERLDEVLCLVMRAPASYTGEDVVEFQGHGGPAPLSRVLRAVLAAGARPAGPGEFTRRAFMNGRLDLAQAEAVADLIAGASEAAARMATAQLDGGLSRRLGGLRERLAELLARLEAEIDFADDDGVEPMGAEALGQRLQAVADELAHLIADAGRGRRYREGARVVIAGRPNVGKSTLMNALLRAERAIVTAEPGTTRDVIEDGLELAGMPVRLLDTAGIRSGAGEVERLGVARAQAAVAGADLVLFLIDGSQPLADEDARLRAGIAGPLILAVNKCDLPSVIDGEAVSALAGGAPIVRVSALAGEGVGNLEAAAARALLGGAPGEDPIVSNARHADALARTAEAVTRARSAAASRLSPEFVAADLRTALASLGEITGETATDELLDLIFSRFCIGK
jgi:tRNA modification GTPase